MKLNKEPKFPRQTWEGLDDLRCDVIIDVVVKALQYALTTPVTNAKSLAEFRWSVVLKSKETVEQQIGPLSDLEYVYLGMTVVHGFGAAKLHSMGSGALM